MEKYTLGKMSLFQEFLMLAPRTFTFHKTFTSEMVSTLINPDTLTSPEYNTPNWNKTDFLLYHDPCPRGVRVVVDTENRKLLLSVGLYQDQAQRDYHPLRPSPIGTTRPQTRTHCSILEGRPRDR